MKTKLSLLPTSIALMLVSCADEPEPVASAPTCNPLVSAEGECFLPFPSDVFMVPDSSLPSGRRLVLEGESELKDDSGRSIDLSDWRPIDGFSRVPIIAATLGTPMSPEGFVTILDDPSKSADLARSQTLLIDAQSGALLRHFVDVDAREEPLLKDGMMIVSREPLEELHRYIVLIRRVRDHSGELIPAPSVFSKIRDGAPPVELEALATRYEHEIFEPLRSMSIDVSELQLAWDFTTGSDEHVTRDMFRVRQLTLQWLEENTPGVTVDSLLVHEDGDDWRVIEGRISGPRFVSDDEPGALLARDESGNVVQNGTTEFTFRSVIPRSVIDAAEPRPFYGYGHGFFGDKSEGTTNVAGPLGAVPVSIDWLGMHETDRAQILDDLSTDPRVALRFGDRVHQAMANWIVTARAMRTVFPGLPEFQHETGPRTGQPIMDAEHPYYFGISQGHILGGVMAAVNDEFSRFAFNVGGAGFTQMMFRAVPFRAFWFAVSLQVKDRLQQVRWAALAQSHFDRFDPAIYGRYILKTPLSDTPKKVLMQIGLGDRQVPNMASFLHARFVGLAASDAMSAEHSGLPAEEMPADSGLTVFDLGVDTDFYGLPEPPVEDNEVHRTVRKLPEVQEQLRQFFKPDGQVIHPCAGPCVIPSER